MAVLSPPGTPARAPRVPAVLYSILAGAIVVALVGVALTARQPPPPTVAEFAPQSVEQIKQAPGEQSSAFGGGPGGAGSGQVGGGSQVAGAQQPVEVPRVRRCVGDPPRQTEDPESPPCVPYFDGDNGGATYKGVTRNEIRIAIPANGGFAAAMANYFNSRYEFYGRKLVMVRGIDTGFGGATAQKMTADAVKADEELKVFASTLYGDSGGEEYVYYDELARRGLVSMNGRPVMASEPDFQRFHPYEWSYLPGFDYMTRNEAEWICNALKDKNAEFGGGSYLLTKRVFGRVTTVRPDGYKPDLRPASAILSGCGIQLKDDLEIVMDGNDQSGFQQAQSIVTRLQVDGVTTIICNCHTNSSGYYMAPVATKQGYFPEWLISTYMYQAEDTHALFWDSQQVSHSFGISWWDKQLPPYDEPWYRAVREGDPNRNFPNAFDYYEARWFFNSIRMLAAGIQMAGPKLNPQTFADGLMKTKFPNPNCGAAPYYQACVGFAPGDHVAVNDGALIWLSKSEESDWFNAPGAMCFANHGVRYRLGTWPSDNAGLFQPPCY